MTNVLNIRNEVRMETGKRNLRSEKGDIDANQSIPE